MSSNQLPPVDLSSLLTILGDAISKEVTLALDGTGLRHSHGYLIQRLLVAPATATEMAAELGITQQAVSKTVKELVSLGHVELTTDPADARRRPVRLTARGQAAVTKARKTRKTIDGRIRATLGAARFDSVTADLTLALDALQIRQEVENRTVQPPSGSLD